MIRTIRFLGAALGGLIGITLVVELTFGAPMWILVRAASYFEPDAFALDRLVRVLCRVEGHPAHWTTAKFRHDCIADLTSAISERPNGTLSNHVSIQDIQDQIDQDRSLLVRLYFLLQKFDEEAESRLQELKRVLRKPR